MYASRRIDVKQWEHQPPDERYTVKIERGGKPVVGIQNDCISSVEEEVMYWRKANHIHAWFVDNVQDGQDDCRPYYVEVSKIHELYDVCQEVLEKSTLVDGMVTFSEQWNSKHKTWEPQREPGQVIENPSTAIELLPTREGFFFGNTEYNEWYLNDVRDTRNWAKRMICNSYHDVPGEIYYQSSW